MIDLRSDTVTQPSEAMREAMADAEVGDDVYGESNRTSEAPFDERLRPRETRSAVDLASRCVLRDRGGHGVAADPSEDHVPSVSTLRWIGRVEPSTT